MSNFLAVYGQLLWFLQVFLPFEAKMATKTHVWLDLPFLKTEDVIYGLKRSHSLKWSHRHEHI